MTEPISIRRATVDDAVAISGIWQAIVAERDYSAVSRAFTPDEERKYIASLSPREAVFVAEVGTQVVGFQSFDLWLSFLSSMEHVGQVGTFVLREWRGRGLGRQLAEHTFAFAREHGFEKLVIFVRAKNVGAQSFYENMGFVECGRFARQVKIGDDYDDEILMERFV